MTQIKQLFADKNKLRLFFSVLLLLLSLGGFSQNKIKIYKIDQLVHRISNPDTIYVVNFWATWCKPCVAELPEFEKLQADSAKTNLKVLLVTMDFKEDISKKLKPFLAKNKMKCEVVLLDETDATTFIPKLDNRWSGAIPATLVKQGEKRSFAESKLTYEKLVDLVKKTQ